MKTQSISLAAILAAVCAPACLAQTSNWVDFVDETATRITYDINVPDLAGLDCEDEIDQVACDLDGDGDLDLVLGRKGGGYGIDARHNFLLMNNNGMFVDSTASKAPGFLTHVRNTRDVICSDVEGDGDADVIFANTFNEQPELWLNDGSGNLTMATNWFTSNGSSSFSPGLNSCAVVAGDVDGDGDEDLFLSTYALAGTDLSSRLLINDGTGHFTDETNPRMFNGGGNHVYNNYFISGATMADANGDGALDIQVSRVLSGIWVAFNDGSGNFSCTDNIGGPSLYMHAAGDLTNDGAADYYAVGDAKDKTIYNLGGTACSMTNANLIVGPSFRTYSLGGNALICDVDGDGFADAGVCDTDTIEANDCGNRGFALLQNQGGIAGRPFLKDPNSNGNSSAIDLPWNESSWDVSIFDIDGDGKVDLVLSTITGLKIFIQT